MNGNQKALVGAIAGIAIGAALGILFAPDKGSETRSKIARSSKRMANQLETQFNDFVKTVSQKFDELRSEASPAPKNGQGMDEEVTGDLASGNK